ncbi:MAG: hypothetical protein COW59_06615 [Lysobacterales bacterium CG17_big_fil_post_rev_8_21_14_2_50_64_11]|nr:MAG: hypothetical protein COW59_06615 [Xanthomonadales bacterium CG17_big_fil_post_rev_8_21_14_2_50_64_11]PIX59959.1 MAG: hypothetical protein COZ47_09690 [Xanthomonadales bacterium CG_4_10_14_3_um_filter_64_11]
MKIIIETSESERVALQPQEPNLLRQAASGSIADLVAVDAGPPSESLLQSLGGRSDAQAVAMDGAGEEGYQSMVMAGTDASFSRH